MTSSTRTLLARIAVALTVVGAIAAGMLLALAFTVGPDANPAAAVVVDHTPTAPTAPLQAPQPQPAPEVPGAAHTADEAFLADLLGPDTDLSEQQAQQLIDLARRYCDKVVTGVGHVPGAEQQTREGWLAGLTMPGPQQLTLDEATKLLDVAEAAYCPTGARS